MGATRVLIIILTLALPTLLFILLFKQSLDVDISPWPSNRQMRRALIEALPDSVQAQGEIWDLGSGWGGLVQCLAEKYPQSQVIGVELSWIPWLMSQLYNRLSSQKNITIRRENFYDTSLSHASLVVCYLFPGAMESLRSKFKSELPPDSWVASITFEIPGWHPERVVEIGEVRRLTIYLYRLSSQD
ncbi:MAG: class I SAM-dependent methyltransferase [Magnetococcales bacterium]|nr:class I SAM-dependent methyltransferase [Magnetococcales bacterium]